ncbi:MAG: SUF system NifU family Fe-S cluster assembly protein [Gammaproteobacteria bacterium]
MDLRQLYQEVIVDHNRSPRNFRRIERPDQTLEGFNPLCGDRLTVYVKRDGDTIADVAFEGSGCAISVASASLMTEALKGKPVAEAERLFEQVHDLLTGASEAALEGKLTVLAGVREYPSRIKCATLAWHTLVGALHGEHKAVKTE